MKEKVNVAELLKDCPKGMELDCTIFDNITLEECTSDHIYIRLNNGELFGLSIYGNCIEFPISVCVIFPKGKTTWEGFQRPFKDGDIIADKDGNIAIYKSGMHYNKKLADYYCVYRHAVDKLLVKKDSDEHFGYIEEKHLATEEEKQKLFDAIKANGYKWNAETKTLEKLITRNKFQIGAKITNGKIIGKIRSRDVDSYQLEDGTYVFFNEVHKWELVPNKFDISTLKPFDKVLTRVTTGDVWGNDFFGYYKDGWFHCSGHIAVHYCIPYNDDTKHLLGTTNDCDEFYKTWKL